MAKVSVIIPCRGEQYQIQGASVLQRTIDDVYTKATGDFEVIVIFDGPPYQQLREYPGLRVITLPVWQGTKIALNEGIRVANGKYIMKTDAHCMFDVGFDEKLQQPMEDNWIVMPRFYVLDAENWQWQDERFYDYFFLPCPFTDPRGFRFKAGGHWRERTRERLPIPVDENMKLHGSAWFTNRDFYLRTLGGLDPSCEGGSWNGEDIELTMKTWLGGFGKLMVNKNTWYAHMHRGGQRPREYGFSHRDAENSARWSARYWTGNGWDGQMLPFSWLIEKFAPVPTWPANWQELLQVRANEYWQSS